MFRTARETLRKSLVRFRNRQFLDATMAAAALVATADGEITFSELNTLDQVLETVQSLQIYDPHVAVDIYRDYADAIAADGESGRRDALDAIRKIGSDREAADLLIRVAVAISKADGEFSAAESRTITDICDVLGVAVPAGKS